MFFDSHCHLTDESLMPHYGDILSRMHHANVHGFINIGSDISSSKAAIDQCKIARQKSFACAASAGFHPHEANAFDEESIKVLSGLWNNPLCAAVGEIGLDYFYDETNTKYPGPARAVQLKVLLAQLQQAVNCDMPVIIHNREADDDIVNAIGQFPKLRGVVHCFSTSWEVAEKVLSRGFYLGFTGMVTFKNAANVRKVAHNCPLDRLLIETDSPYLAPVPYRGKTNEPTFVPFVAQAIADERHVDIEEIAAASAENAGQLFGVN